MYTRKEKWLYVALWYMWYDNDKIMINALTDVSWWLRSFKVKSDVGLGAEYKTHKRSFSQWNSFGTILTGFQFHTTPSNTIGFLMLLCTAKTVSNEMWKWSKLHSGYIHFYRHFCQCPYSKHSVCACSCHYCDVMISLDASRGNLSVYTDLMWHSMQTTHWSMGTAGVRDVWILNLHESPAANLNALLLCLSEVSLWVYDS